ncbi:DUF397 domain-containing protein [Streptomyces sp. NPDC002580]
MIRDSHRTPGTILTFPPTSWQHFVEQLIGSLPTAPFVRGS